MARRLKLDIIVDDNGAVRTLRQVDDGVRNVQTTARTSATAIGRVSTGLKGIAGTAAGIVGVTSAMQALSAGVRFAGSATIGMNATLEQSTLVFQTLTGDAGAAEEHVRGLFEFAARTPFETGPIINASRKLEVFGGEALNTRENLTLVGDAAAATRTPFEELAFWVGRLFAALEGGQPIGEATLRLTELGVISPQASAELRSLAGAGVDGTEVFRLFQDQLATFTGAMELQQSTWQGVTSTLREGIQLLIADETRGLFEALTVSLGGLATKLSETDSSGTSFGQSVLNFVVPGLSAVNARASAWAASQRDANAALNETIPTIDAITPKLDREAQAAARAATFARMLAASMREVAQVQGALIPGQPFFPGAPPGPAGLPGGVIPGLGLTVPRPQDIEGAIFGAGIQAAIDARTGGGGGSVPGVGGVTAPDGGGGGGGGGGFPLAPGFVPGGNVGLGGGFLLPGGFQFVRTGPGVQNPFSGGALQTTSGGDARVRVTNNIDARGAVFESEAVLDRLAQRIAARMFGGSIGPATGA